MISHWAAEHGYAESTTHLYEPHQLPDVSDYDALIIMGGTMGVHDDAAYPWLAAEKAHIKAAIDANKHVLGICLGAQLIADALGAHVAPHTHKEIGVFPILLRKHPITKGLASPMDVLHWHGDRFEIPEGATHLASSDACDNQAFIYGNNVLGLQFHSEMDSAAIDKIIDACGHELVADKNIQNAVTIRTQSKSLQGYGALSILLDNWTNSHFITN